MYKKNTTREVWNYLSRDIAIQKSMQKNLINTRALANHIKKGLDLKSSTHSVISAIRRYKENKKGLNFLHEMDNFFKDSTVVTRNNMACIILNKRSHIQKYLSQLSKVMDFEKGDELRMIKGKNALRILTEMKNVDKIKELIPSKDLKVNENLSEIKIKISPDAEKTKGVAARVANELYLHDINISEIIFCIPAIIIYIEQKDLLKAHEGIAKLCRGE